MKVEHNRKLFLIIIILIILLIGLINIISNKEIDLKEGRECETDEACAPVSCCHPDSCVLKENVIACGIDICTSVCSGPLDCGAGRCGCVKGKCKIISLK